MHHLVFVPVYLPVATWGGHDRDHKVSNNAFQGFSFSFLRVFFFFSILISFSFLLPFILT